MHLRRSACIAGTLAAAFWLVTLPASAEERHHFPRVSPFAQLGPRPFYLVDRLQEGDLKRKLSTCSKRPFFFRSDFSISHRGAPLQFPEHTRESYEAAARMGAGIQECDVTFTQDGELVCRHAQCDLHTTTNILTTPLASKCREPFSPAEVDPETGELVKPASATCCASDLTLSEFKSLCGKMDASDPTAATAEAYQGGTAPFRTDLYNTCSEVLSHRESIRLFGRLGAKYTPELKSGLPEDVQEVFGSQEAYAQALIDDYIEAEVPPRRVFPQSFNPEDVFYWVESTGYGENAVLLRDAPAPDDPEAFVQELVDRGVPILAPAIPLLLESAADGAIVPSELARVARAAGLELITWSIERSGRIVEDVLVGGGTFYYQTTLDALTGDGDILRTIDVLARDVGVIGMFTDWPATTTFYANCMGLP